ncbi:MAG TPA: pyridoxal phosphate-dependent aminotransferase [Bryobacteraceae bacterium]|nr:pyridoxal phosphate-dependent aminotransferase [Bryobacteraceae bacterium]HPT26711.1 pyridoxal phosphate-dependent aminotransferase [Bryobacteraceae bacterium]
MQATSTLADRIGLISVSSTAKVSAEADRLRRAGVDVVDFGVGEPDFPTPDNIKQAAVHALDSNFTRYTAMAGVQELRQAICDRHNLEYGTTYTPTECVATVGGKHAIFNLTQAVINPGDEAIIPVPYWVTYKDVVNYAGGRCVFVETREEDGFALTAAEVERAITPKTRIIMINSPCNPSGAVIDNAELEKISYLARDNGIWLMTDECYSHFLYDSTPFSAASLPGMKETTIVAGSLSKTYAMTGWRIGFVLAPAAVCTAIVKLQSHSTSNPTSIAQKGAIEALMGPQDSVSQMLSEYHKRRDYVVGRLRAMPGVVCPEPRGAFYAYPNIAGVLSPEKLPTAMAFAERLLAEKHVAVVPGEAFGTKSHVRISYASSIEDLKKGLDRFEAFVKENIS